MVAIMIDNEEPELQDRFSKAVYLKRRARLKDVCSVRVFWIAGEELKVTIYTSDFRFSKIYLNAFTMLLNGMSPEWLVNHVLREFRKSLNKAIFA